MFIISALVFRLQLYFYQVFKNYIQPVDNNEVDEIEPLEDASSTIICDECAKDLQPTLNGLNSETMVRSLNTDEVDQLKPLKDAISTSVCDEYTKKWYLLNGRNSESLIESNIQAENCVELVGVLHNLNKICEEDEMDKGDREEEEIGKEESEVDEISKEDHSSTEESDTTLLPTCGSELSLDDKEGIDAGNDQKESQPPGNGLGSTDNENKHGLTDCQIVSNCFDSLLEGEETNMSNGIDNVDDGNVSDLKLDDDINEIETWNLSHESDTDSAIFDSYTSSPGPLSEPALPGSESSTKKEEDRTQKDRCVEVYPETIRQRQRNMAPSPSKVDIKNWEPSAVANEDGKKFLPSVKALRNQFENGKPNSNSLVRTASNSSSTNSLVLSSLDTSSGFGSLTSSQATFELASTTTPPVREMDTAEEERVEPIFSQFKEVDEELKQMMSKPPSTQGWNPHSLLKRLYYIPDAPKIHRREAPFVNIEGYLEKLPSGRKKATFWNAWKRRYFVAKDGILYYYQNNQTEKPNMKLCLMGGKIEIMDANMVTVDDGGRESRNAGMLGIDDGKGHYVVVRCTSRQEAERWKTALETHTIDDFSSQYVQPWPRPTNPTLLRDTLVIDIGSCSVRAGVLASQPTLPQLFFPSVVATNRETRNQIWGTEALMPDVRSVSTISFPVRPSHKISKFSVDLNAVSSLLQKTFNDLKVDPKNYNIQLSVPRVLNPHTQAELLKVLFDKFEVKSVNMTHQSILALYAYNATSGVIVDIGERLDVVPVIDGYIVDGGVSRVPYGGYRIMDHLRQFLFQKNISLINDVDSYVIRQVLETICYCAQHYNTEKQRCSMNPENFEKSAPLADFFPDSPQYEMFRDISLEFARFQATEGLFNPDAWGLDHPGLHKLVHKAIQECSMDIRKEMSRSIFLAGGVTQLPGIADRLTVELDNLTPPAIRPKVHSSPYRYHAAYLGACELAESPAFSQSKITKEEWTKQGNSSLRKWAL